MRLKRTIPIAFLLLFCLGTLGDNALRAHEETYTLAHRDVFGELRRDPVVFKHRIHEEALDAEGCGVCHHTPDEKTGQLSYVEDDELSCKECHGPEKTADASALREAYHGNCTPCHRTRGKVESSKSGPTTCGECHKPTE